MSVGAVCLRIARAILTVNNSYDLFIQASPYHRLKKSNVKNIRNTIKLPILLVIKLLLVIVVQTYYWVIQPYCCAVMSLGQKVKTQLEYILYRICHNLCLGLLLSIVLIDSNIGKIGQNKLATVLYTLIGEFMSLFGLEM